MVTPSENCPSCLKPKTRASGGFVTQFVDVCRCGQSDLPLPEELQTVYSCQTCNKLINTRKSGSLTQWVFKPDSCQCETPVPVKRSAPSAGIERPVFVLEEDDGEELDLNPESFPVDRYQPKARLGAGASGSVYLSRDRLLGKRVAVKLLHELTAQQLMAFQEEARITSRLHHPNIIQVLDFGPTGSGVPYMVLEYIDRAESLQKYLESNGPVDEETWFHIFYKVADALSHAHDCGVFHRDLKPSNILLSGIESGDPQVKLIDFGVAKLKINSQEPTIVQGRTIAGTPAYMPPELAQGRGFDSRSEIYSLGCVMYESVTGSPPFYGETAMEIIAKHTNEPVPLVSEVADRDYAEGLQMIIARCLEKNVDDRFSSATELRNEIDRIYVSMSRTDQSRVGVLSEPSLDTLPVMADAMPHKMTHSMPHTQISAAPMANIIPTPAEPPRNSDIRFGTILTISILCFATIVILALRTGQSGNNETINLSQGSAEVARSINTLKVRPEAFHFDFSSNTWISTAPLTDNDLIALSSIKNGVERLDLSNGGMDGQTGITDKGWAAIAELPLRNLNLSRAVIRDSGVRLVASIPTLKDLDLGHTDITDEGITALKRTHIARLALEQCIFISTKSSSALASMKDLKFLNLNSTDVDNRGLEEICGALDLECLKLSNCDKLTADGLIGVAKCKTLQVLQIAGDEVNAGTLRNLRALPLKELVVSNCRDFDNQCLEAVVESWPKMEKLQIDQTSVTGSNLKTLLRLENLEQLNVSSLRLTDQDVAPLTGISTLTNLDLSENDITDKTVSALLPRRRLRVVLLNKCILVSKGAVKSLVRTGKKVQHYSMVRAEDLSRDMIENLAMPSER